METAGSDVVCTQAYGSPCGGLVLGAWRGGLCLCVWAGGKLAARMDGWAARHLGAACRAGDAEVLRRAAGELDEYFAGRRTAFTVPLLLAGTAFQRRAWRALADIPYGASLSYAGQALAAGCPGAVRAVAGANAANPLSIFVPCHRVVGSDGSLAGYGGGVEAKRFLLELERGRARRRGAMLHEG